MGRTFGIRYFSFAHKLGQLPVPSGPMGRTVPFHDGCEFKESQLPQYQQLTDGKRLDRLPDQRVRAIFGFLKTVPPHNRTSANTVTVTFDAMANTSDAYS